MAEKADPAISTLLPAIKLQAQRKPHLLKFFYIYDKITNLRPDLSNLYGSAQQCTDAS